MFSPGGQAEYRELVLSKLLPSLVFEIVTLQGSESSYSFLGIAAHNNSSGSLRVRFLVLGVAVSERERQ